MNDIQDVTDSQRQRGGGARARSSRRSVAPCLATENVAALFVFSDFSTSWEGSQDARSRSDSSRPTSREGGVR